MTAQAFCTDCGTARVAAAKFCGTCGTPFASPQINPPTPPQTPPQSPVLRTPEDLVHKWLSLACLVPYGIWLVLHISRSFTSFAEIYVALILHTNLMVTIITVILLYALVIASFGQHRAIHIAKSHLVGGAWIIVAIHVSPLLITIGRWFDQSLSPWILNHQYLATTVFLVALIIVYTIYWKLVLAIREIGLVITRDVLPAEWLQYVSARASTTTTDTTPVWQLIGWWAFPFLTYFVAALLW